MKHMLAAAGAAFDAKGYRLFSNTTSGRGSALCSCGWLSEPVEFGRQRKALHKAHVEKAGLFDGALAELIELIEDVAEEPLSEPEEPVEGVAEPEPEPAPDPETAEEDVREDVSPVEVGAPGILEGDVATFRVFWPETVARLFWKALAKDGAKILADAYGLERVSNESRGLLEVKGKLKDALWFSDRLPGLFASANNALKLWRKTSPEYKAHDLRTNEGRKTAFIAEQNFLRTFCYTVAGIYPDDMKAPGFAEGLTFLESQEVWV